VVATGTGTDPTKAVEYAKEDLDVYDFELTPAEMDTLNGLGEAQSELA
jgi:diketogulonate reductase-like aldo/keto reductase